MFPNACTGCEIALRNANWYFYPHDVVFAPIGTLSHHRKPAFAGFFVPKESPPCAGFCILETSMSSSFFLEMGKLLIDGSPIAILGWVVICQAEVLRRVVEQLSRNRRK